MKVFSLTIHDSTPPNRKTIITTKVLSFLWKKHSPFSLNFLYGTHRDNLIIIANLNKNHPR